MVTDTYRHTEQPATSTITPVATVARQPPTNSEHPKQPVTVESKTRPRMKSFLCRSQTPQASSFAAAATPASAAPAAATIVSSAAAAETNVTTKSYTVPETVPSNDELGRSRPSDAAWGPLHGKVDVWCICSTLLTCWCV